MRLKRLRYVKLVRDARREPSDMCEELRLERVAYDADVRHALRASFLVNKLHEEVAELARTLDDAHEYADVLHALHELAQENKVSWGRVLATCAEKNRSRGTLGSTVLVRYADDKRRRQCS